MNESAIHITETLRIRIAQGDESAFTAFFEHYQDRVLNIAFYFTQSLSHAQDIVQDVFIKIWTQRERLATIEFPDSWVATIARHHSINALQKIAREQLIGERYPDYLPSISVDNISPIENKDLERYIAQALGKLSEQQRRVFELGKLQGMNRDEIAKTLGISPNTVKMHLVRATKYVRAYLATRLDHLLFVTLVISFPG